MRHESSKWVGFLAAGWTAAVYLAVCGCHGNKPKAGHRQATRESEAEMSPAETLEQVAREMARLARTEGHDPDITPDRALEKARRLARQATRPMLEGALRREFVDTVLAPQPLRFSKTWEVDDDPLTFYFGQYAVDLPRALFRRDDTIVHTCREGGIKFLVAGDCGLAFIVYECFVAPTLREMPAEMELPDEAIAEVERVKPGYTEGFKQELYRRLGFDHDYDLIRALFSTDFRDLDVDTMSVPELLATLTLVLLKPMLAVDGIENGISLVETPHFRGFQYGSLDRGERTIVDLHHADRSLGIDISYLQRRHADLAPLRVHLNAIIASVRPHNSVTPGRDMLAAARAEVADPRGDHSDEIARCLVLCSSRYHDAFEEAVALGETLVPEDWPETRTKRFLDVLSRRGEKPRPPQERARKGGRERKGEGERKGISSIIRQWPGDCCLLRSTRLAPVFRAISHQSHLAELLRLLRPRLTRRNHRR